MPDNFGTLCIKGLKGDSHLPKNYFYLLQRKPSKNDGKYFLFQVKKLFLFLRFLNFYPDLLVNLIMNLILKFVTSQTGQQIITIHISQKVQATR